MHFPTDILVHHIQLSLHCLWQQQLSENELLSDAYSFLHASSTAVDTSMSLGPRKHDPGNSTKSENKEKCNMIMNIFQCTKQLSNDQLSTPVNLLLYLCYFH